MGQQISKWFAQCAVQTAIQVLMPVAEQGGDTMLPRIGITQALYPGETVPTPRKKAAKKISRS